MDSVIVLLTQSQFVVLLPVVCTNLALNIFPLKPNLSLIDQNGELSNISDQSLTSLSVLEILKNRPGRFRDTRKVIYQKSI